MAERILEKILPILTCVGNGTQPHAPLEMWYEGYVEGGGISYRCRTCGRRVQAKVALTEREPVPIAALASSAV